MDKKFDEAIFNLCENLYIALKNISAYEKQQIQEIRIRSFKPIILHLKNKGYFLNKNGTLELKSNKDLFIATQVDIENSINKMCNYSVYSYQNEVKNGYIMLKGGHRVGLCGTAVFNNIVFTNIKNISSLNIRIARNISLISIETIKKLTEKFSGILIVGEPSSGKTTFLKSISKNLSIGAFTNLKKVVVIDEKGELSGTNGGKAENDLGFCDILNYYPKPVGIMQALRNLAPDIIVCDEIGGNDDIKALKLGVNSGVKFIASIHAGNIDELLRRPQAKDILNTGAFDKIVLLKGKETPGEIENIILWPENKNFSKNKCLSAIK